MGKSIILAFLISVLVLHPYQEKALNDKMQSSNPPSHEVWNQLLQKHVNDKGFVDYQGFKKDKSRLLNYTKQLSQNPPAKNWTKNEKKAYLINTYNAFTVLLIVNNYPLESIKDIGGFLSSPFAKKFIQLGQETYSLNDVEKGMLLEMGDARAHFAINCASYSCPKLQNEAFTAAHLNDQLDQATLDFLSSDKNKISKKSLQLSKIFKWYSADFESYSGSVIHFINNYTDQDIATNAAIDYLDYDWSLNEQ